MSLNVTFQTGDTHFKAVKEVSFELQPGKVLGIVGESGSGKSVTSLALMRLLDETKTQLSGQVLLNNIDLLNIPEAEMRTYRGNRIGMIFQEPMTSLNPVLTCGYQVAEAIQLHLKVGRKEEAKLRTINLFKEVQLPRPDAIFKSYPHQISGGQKQRVMIAMALSCNPEILIADEPTTALDVSVQKSILELLLKIKNERNSSLIFISHDLGVISGMADEVVVMYKGRIVEQATTEQIFANPQHPYTKGLLACRPSANVQLKKLPVISDFLKTDQQGKIQSSGITIREIRDRYAVTEDEKNDRQKKYQQEALLKVKNLNTWFPLKSSLFQLEKEVIKAVHDVSFKVFPGETLGLVGESGCGKTTLGRSIIRLIEPTSGKIIFKNQDILALPANEMRRTRKKMQLIFQDPYSSLNPKQTVGNAILEPMTVHKLYTDLQQRKKKVLELLDRVNLLPEHFNRYPHEFSGGQRQRIVIARALALQPEFLICDESVAALDVSVQAQVLNLLKELQSDFKLTYLFISHDLTVVKHLADRMLVMNQGKIIEAGDSQQIFHHPKEAYTQKLIASIPDADLLR